MKKEDFLIEIYKLTDSLTNLIKQLPSIPELEEDFDTEDISVLALSADILTVESTAESLHDDYFDKA